MLKARLNEWMQKVLDAYNNKIIEKEYQNGGNALRNKGYKVIALASIKEMTSNIIQFN